MEALTFDVFGTTVDWRSSIVREGRRLSEWKGLEVDWESFADAWRAGYVPAMERVRTGEIPWATLDELHRMILEGLLAEHGIADALSEAEIRDLNRVWHRLRPWDDAVAGLDRLRSRYIVAALSNGNVGLLVRMARNAGLPWDVILSAQLARRYKPDPEVYETAAELLDLPPAKIMMVATHKRDLRAAGAVGFRTAWVPRPLEHGAESDLDTAPDPDFDLTAADFQDLASRLGT